MPKLVKTPQRNVRLPVGLWALVKATVTFRHTTVQAFLTETLEQGLKEIATYAPGYKNNVKREQRNLGALPTPLWAKVVYACVLRSIPIQDFITQALEGAANRTGGNSSRE